MSEEPLDADVRAELVRLRDEVAELRGRTGGGRWRAVVSAVLITLGCVLVPLAGVGFWAANEVSDTERYVENVTPLAGDPAIRNAAANRVTGEVMRALDVQAIVGQIAGRLPPRVGDKLKGLSGPMADGVQGFVRDKVGQVIASDTFQTVWVQANRAAHKQLVAVLSGEGSQLLKVNGGAVSLDLGPIIDRVKQKLVASGLGLAASIPELHPTIELFDSAALVTWQRWYSWLITLRWALPVLALILLALGVYVAKSRRRALAGVGIGLMAGMLVLAAALAAFRAASLGSVARHGLDQAAAADLFDTLARFLRGGLRTVLVLGLVIAAAAFFTGPSATAVRTRSALKRAIGVAGSRLNTGRFGAWLARNATVARAGLVALAALVFVFWDRPTGAVVFGITVATLLLLGVVQLLARDP
ncbi:hypothetical protein [Nonomuraea endophytica]|uniref:Integral membrane protein n=1 Tax=Nonomuraea endophytica TaxID=714136 RepID=A0A7W8A7I3_9ACTN|nr:hypothetical protein [Nonomuraea endophytica]MBB5080076.1 hypothetical protein [Nonomuraea endophytica]